MHGSWAPDRNDEYLFYQALLGAWPAEAEDEPLPDRAPQDLVDRLDRYLQKAAREAKVHTSWIHEVPAYGHAMTQFVTRTLTGPTAARFLASFVPFERRLARAGMVNSLAQLVLKIASPGVPDFYQGTELWDFSFVDPDNRRPVDFDARRAALSTLDPVLQRLETGGDVSNDVRAMVAGWTDGLVKLFVTVCGLRFRRAHPDVVLDGSYHPLEADGPGADHLVAFARAASAGTLVAAVPRLVLGVGPDTWSATSLRLPASLPATEYRHLLTGEAVEVSHGRIRATSLFSTVPVALLFAPR
jgi:(1->4)-alpha-D-glucan 1-alpha-D-glucosylmutase